MLDLFAQNLGVHEVSGYAVGWGTLSLINAGLAQAKGRSGLLWWFVSLFLGPLATFLIVAVLDREPQRAEESALR
jgi:hypothetical protein